MISSFVVVRDMTVVPPASPALSLPRQTPEHPAAMATYPARPDAAAPVSGAQVCLARNSVFFGGGGGFFFQGMAAG